MSVQKLIEKLKELHKLCGNTPQVCIVDKAIDIIKSHDFQETKWRSCLTDPPDTNRDVALCLNGFVLTGYRTEVGGKWEKYDCLSKSVEIFPQHHDEALWHDLPPAPEKQPSEEVRAIEAELKAAKKWQERNKDIPSSTIQTNCKNAIWVLEQRLKEAKGEK